MATYVIGDVQGCMPALRKLVDLVQFDPAHDCLWFAGDLVNRGPESLAVLRFVKSLGRAALTVLGNHDLHLLAIWAGVTTLNRKDTLQSVLSAPDCDELLTWLRYQPLLHQEGQYLLVHAGLLPQWTCAQAVSLAREVETALQDDDFRKHLPIIYFRPAQACWKNDLSEMERLGLTTNILTRIRVCSPNGTPDLSFKGTLDQIPQGYMPWFQVPNRGSHTHTILFGHWSALGVVIQENLIGLDGGCVWGRELVAIRLEDRELFRVACGEP